MNHLGLKRNLTQGVNQSCVDTSDNLAKDHIFQAVDEDMG